MVRLPYYFIIALFTFFLREFMSPLSILLVILSSCAFFLKRMLGKKAINFLCIIIFAFYILTYGKIITPEIGINFLLNVVLLKFMETRKFRDEVMLIFGLILLTSAGALFDKSLFYLIFFSASFITLIQSIFKLNGLSLFKLKNIPTYAAQAVFITALFFVLPRIQNPIPFSLSGASEGEIGYRTDANIANIERLSENDSKVFWVKLKGEIPREELYWRGNVISSTDGWNWQQGAQDQGVLNYNSQNIEVKDEYRLFIKSPYLFFLDVPSILETTQGTFLPDETLSFPSHYVKQTNRYFIQRDMGEFSNKDFELETRLDNKTKELINFLFPGESLEEVLSQFEGHLKQQGFSYSWNPGRMRSLQDFFNKKIGFCTHYASSLALVLRTKGYPARLVSGFQGGRYNPYGQFYEITQNDAHAWVEVYHQNKWMRVDPTSFIAPERIMLDYQEVAKNNFVVPEIMKDGNFALINIIKMFFSQWDFEFYQFMDQWDSTEQSSFFTSFKIQKHHLYFLSLLCFLLLGVFFLQNKRMSKREKLWSNFLTILERNGIFYQGNFSQLQKQIADTNWQHKQTAQELVEKFQILFYGNEGDEKEIVLLLKSIYR